jgi:hypothetical protein
MADDMTHIVVNPLPPRRRDDVVARLAAPKDAADNAAAAGALPPGWVEVHNNPVGGPMYYAHLQTRATSWVLPAAEPPPLTAARPPLTAARPPLTAASPPLTAASPPLTAAALGNDLPCCIDLYLENCPESRVCDCFVGGIVYMFYTLVLIISTLFRALVFLRLGGFLGGGFLGYFGS